MCITFILDTPNYSLVRVYDSQNSKIKYFFFKNKQFLEILVLWGRDPYP